jgi:hypothetical protein
VTLEYHKAMKNFWRNLALLAAITILFSSCGLLLLISLVFFQPRGCWDLCYPPTQPPPESINFNTDLRILRGDWRSLIPGSNEFDPGKAVSLTLEATYVDTTSYTIAGTFQVAGDAALTVQGLVKGGDYQAFTKSANRLSPPPPPQAFAELLLSSGVGQAATQVLIFCPYAYQAPTGWQYSAVLEPVTPNHVPFQSCYGSTLSSKNLIVGRKPATP